MVTYMNNGVVYWITGLSGAGKTTIGTILYHKLREQKLNVVLLDGDILREVFGNDLGYLPEDRMKSAMRNAKLCKMLSDQGIDVVCCTISMFDEVREWNRGNIEKYKEIYIKVPIEILKIRDQKGLYTGLSQGQVRDIVGLDITMQEPKKPDIEIVNDGKDSPEKVVNFILKEL